MRILCSRQKKVLVVECCRLRRLRRLRRLGPSSVAGETLVGRTLISTGASTVKAYEEGAARVWPD